MATPRSFVPVLLSMSMALLAASVPPSPKAAASGPLPDAGSPLAATVTVNAGSPLGTIPAAAFGLNASTYDSHLRDAAVPSLIQQAGVGIMRYPGGSMADVYHWQHNSMTPGQGGYVNPNNTFDAFMGVASRAGAQAMITVNYGSNPLGTAGASPQEAAAWVRYANITRGYGVKYWEIGNEIYGNGTYGAHWETDLHANAAGGGPVYAANALQFIQAMKAVDPTIKIGVVLTAPGNWPDGVLPPGQHKDWNTAVLSAIGSSLDYVDVHWYPQGPGAESDAGLLSTPSQIAGMVSTLRSQIASWAGAHAGAVQIMVTETNSVSYNPGKQTVGLVNALYLSDSVMTWLEHGVANVDWWQLHNGAVTGTNDSPSLYGTANYGDYGLLSNGDALQPPANTPFPPYFGLQMLRYVGRPGDGMIWAASDHALVTAHAVKQANGTIAVLLINKDPNATYNVKLAVGGYIPSYIYSFGEGSSVITPVPNALSQVRGLPIGPYSLTTIILSPIGRLG